MWLHYAQFSNPYKMYKQYARLIKIFPNYFRLPGAFKKIEQRIYVFLRIFIYFSNC